MEAERLKWLENQMEAEARRDERIRVREGWMCAARRREEKE